MNPHEITSVFPSFAQYESHAGELWHKWGIDTPARVAHWIAQMAHESAKFSKVRESLNYSPEGLMATFGSSRISEVQAKRYGRGSRPAQQALIAGIVYGGAWGKKFLGNTEPSDPWDFIGRGLPMVTGRWNYRRCSYALFNDDRLLKEPILLESPRHAFEAGCWFWHEKGLNRHADKDNSRQITCVITGWRGVGSGDSVGYPERVNHLETVRQLPCLQTT